jgi:hypothetical protein
VALTRSSRRLEDAQRRLEAARESLKVLEEQLVHWTDAFEEARLRSLMSETPVSDHDLAEARRQCDIVQREKQRRSGEIDELVAERDRLLRAWSPEEAR